MHIEHVLQCLLLVVTHELHAPSIMRSLFRNCAASSRDPDKIVKDHKDALLLELLAQLKRVLRNHNSTKFEGYITTEKQTRPCLR